MREILRLYCEHLLPKMHVLFIKHICKFFNVLCNFVQRWSYSEKLMKKLKSHGIHDFNFQAWKVVEFTSWKVIKKQYAF